MKKAKEKSRKIYQNKCSRTTTTTFFWVFHFLEPLNLFYAFNLDFPSTIGIGFELKE